MACTDTQTVRLYDGGTDFIVEIKDCKLVGGTPTETVLDISGATSMKIIFKKPDLSSLTVNASLYSDGTDGKIVYSTTGDPAAKTGDLDQTGEWEISGRVTLPGGTWTTDTDTFQVEDILDS